MSGVSQNRVNPLMDGAFILEDAAPGERIIVYRPGDSESRRALELLSGWYFDAGTVVLDVREADGMVKTVTASSIGLTCDRFTGEWELIAMLDDTESSDA